MLSDSKVVSAHTLSILLAHTVGILLAETRLNLVLTKIDIIILQMRHHLRVSAHPASRYLEMIGSRNLPSFEIIKDFDETNI